MLYRSISSKKGKLGFIKYDGKEIVKAELEKLKQVSPELHELIEKGSSLDKNSTIQPYLLVKSSEFIRNNFLGGILIDKNSEDLLRAIILLDIPAVMKTDPEETIVDLLNSLCNYNYEKKKVQVRFLSGEDERLLADLGFEKHTIDGDNYYSIDNPYTKRISTLYDEIEHAQKVLNNWKVMWYENYSDYIRGDYHLEPEVFDSLYSHTAIDERTVFEKSDTFRMDHIESKKAERFLVFNDDGTIEAYKYYKRGKGVTTYESTCNVDDDDYYIKGSSGNKTFKLEKLNGVITISIDDILISYLPDGQKRIHIERKSKGRRRDSEGNIVNASVSFDATTNFDGNLKSCMLEVNTHKRNGKVNGTYRVVANQSGLKSTFYSRKGVKTEIPSSALLSHKLLLLTEPQIQGNVEDEVISSVVTASNSSNQDSKTINIDLNDINMEKIVNCETTALNFFKELVGELPINLLQKRMEETFDFIETTRKQGNPLLKLTKSDNPYKSLNS